MIVLKLEDYCHDGCMRFEPKTIIGMRPIDPEIVVTCEHWAECQYMVRYLKKHGLAKENNNDQN